MNVGAIERFIRCLIDGSAAGARECLSPAFESHHGLDAERYIAHELREFSQRKNWFGGVEFGIDVLHADEAGVRYLIVDRAGALIFEDTMRVDADGLLLGVPSPVEAVSKLFFGHDGGIRRSLAVRSHSGPLVHARPADPGALSFWFSKSSTIQDDDFCNLTFMLAGDDLLERSGLFRFMLARPDSGVAVIPGRVLMRGLDHPHFCDMRPAIFGRKLLLAHGLRIWSVSILMANGETLVVPSPGQGEIECPYDIVSAILTDALDNDWEVRAC